MLSSKIDFVSKYNDLVLYALSAAKEFPDNLCDYLVNEFEFEAVIITKIKDKTFELLGKSTLAKKSLKNGTEITCKHCQTVQIPYN
ncbi:MAG: hypothetical protein M5T52_03550 [Ignavibacteriaceae bacterium]|nr:hypothetical protein [Ignavibacteriaceae bacterium]